VEILLQSDLRNKAYNIVKDLHTTYVVICTKGQARFLNLRHRRGNFEHVTLVISGRGRPQENRILNLVKIRKKLRFIQIENFFRRSSIGEM